MIKLLEELGGWSTNADDNPTSHAITGGAAPAPGARATHQRARAAWMVGRL
jgi:hypothetical protein